MGAVMEERRGEPTVTHIWLDWSVWAGPDWWAQVTVRNQRSRCHAPKSRHRPDSPLSCVKATLATNWFSKSTFFKEHPGRLAFEIKLLLRLIHLIDIRYHQGPPTEYDTVNHKISEP